MEEKKKRSPKPKEPITMSRIVYGDYYMVHDVVATDRLNLYKKPRAGNKTDILLGYGFTLPGAIEKMIGDVMANKGQTYDLKGYLSEYRELSEAVKIAVQ